MKTILAIIGAITLLIVLALFAVCGDDDNDNDNRNSFGVIQLVSHRYDDGGDYGDDNGCWDGECYDGRGDGYGRDRYDQNYGSRDDRNRNRRRNRGAFSPGPFDRSPVTICAPYSCNSGGEQSGGNRNDQPPPDEGPQSVGCAIPIPFHCDPKPEVAA